MHCRLPFLLLLASLAAAAEGAPPHIAVFDFQANGASPQLANALTGSVANELQRLGAFRVITGDAIRSVLAADRQRQLLGCDSSECISDITGALEMDYLLTGKVSRVNGSNGRATFTLELALINKKTAAREGSDVQQSNTEAGLISQSTTALMKTMKGLLAARSGSLLLAASEAGATVKLDDVVVGTTPLPGTLAVPAGPHMVRVEKEGFVAFQRELRVGPNETVETNVTMVPSNDFIQSYRATQSKLRFGAWASTTVALLGVGAAGYFNYKADQTYGSVSRPGTFAFHRELLRQGVESDESGDHRAETTRLRTEIQNNQRLMMISAGAAAVGAVAAVTFFVVGDDPGHYDRFMAVEKVGAVVTPDGASGAVSFSF